MREKAWFLKKQILLLSNDIALILRDWREADKKTKVKPKYKVEMPSGENVELSVNRAKIKVLKTKMLEIIVETTFLVDLVNLNFILISCLNYKSYLFY